MKRSIWIRLFVFLIFVLLSFGVATSLSAKTITEPKPSLPSSIIGICGADEVWACDIGTGKCGCIKFVIGPPVSPGPASLRSGPPTDPAPQTSGIIGSAGGNLAGPGGDCGATIPPGGAPDGTTVTITRPYPMSIPQGTFVLRGDGDHICSFGATDSMGKKTSITGNITFCFNLSASDIANAYPGLSMQQWDGGKWVTANVTIDATTNKICASVPGW